MNGDELLNLAIRICARVCMFTIGERYSNKTKADGRRRGYSGGTDLR